MQEKTNSVFIFATANRLTDLPPELLQRFETIWFADFPNEGERYEIWKSLLKKYNSAKLFSEEELTNLIDLTKGFSGREIAQALREARSKAYIEDRELQREDIIEVCEQMEPVRSPKLKEIKGKAREIGGKDASSGFRVKELEK
ncbi:MAG: hypothetical protein KAU14_07385 [Thermoplasmata archaeon]|nr:hypothetical protein [Thermoplasmata archaeon]